MNELLTTEEAAAHLRMSERKLYELIAAGSVPCSKVTGRWLFPKAALDRWVAAGLGPSSLPANEPAPRIVGGSHDPMLEWALRESGAGLASLTEGSSAGLRRLARGEVMAAAIHLHRNDSDDERANVETVAETPGLHDVAVIAFVRREQGLLVAPGNPLALDGIASAAARQARMAQRTDGAGAQLLLLTLLHRLDLPASALNLIKPAHATGADLAQAIRSGRADCGIATRAVAELAGLDFILLAWEQFDLVLRQREYFSPEFQTLLDFLRRPGFAERAKELGGYDCAQTGKVRFAN